MSEAKGKITVIAHVAATTPPTVWSWPSTPRAWAWTPSPPFPHLLPPAGVRHRRVLERHVCRCPHTDFVIYNIPQLAGTALTMSLLNTMLKNPNVVAVKNSSMPTQDIQMFKDAGIKARGEGNFVVFNGPDEQFVSGRVIGADGGIGGTYAVMPELYLP